MKTSIQNLSRLSALLASLGLLPAGRVTAQTFTTLYNFGGNYNPHNPEGGLVLSGNTLYGTAYGGNPSDGCVFGINTDGSGFAIVHGFTGLDGFAPTDGLILSGNTLFGTAYRTVFAVNTDTSGFTILHSFVPGDGTYPVGGVVLSGNTLYGTASRSGIADMGTVFAVNTDSSGFSVLHYFTATDPNSGTNSDGGNPRSTLILSGSTLYGTAQAGGSTSRGTVFAVNTGSLGFTNLHNFTAGTNDGADPYAGVILSGNTLYGTTASGGSSGHGTVFAVNTDGSGFTLVHDFSGGDGAGPVAGLLLSGNTLYGTTAGGGVGAATVFAVNTDGTGFTVLHVFTGDEGNSPQGDLILAGNTLYGTTVFGGTLQNGTVFSLALPLPQLAITPADGNVVLTWPVSATGFTLQSATNLVPPVVWITNSPAPVIINGLNTVTNAITGAQTFFRLSQ
jgi:uncharacterized repeat protein (TIGR03803 family)